MGAIDRVFRGRRPSQNRPLAAIIAGLWKNNEQGLEYDASDRSTMFQDAAGTLPVYMPGSGQVDPPIGLLLDKRLGLVPGAERVSNGSFSNGLAGWNPGAGVTDGGGAAQFTNVAAGSGLAQNAASAYVPGVWYVVSMTVSEQSGPVLSIRLGSAGAFFPVSAGNGAKTLRIQAGGSTATASILAGASGANCKVTGISIRELPGNHAYQSTTTSRPTLSARYNLFATSEDFSNAAWAKSSTATITPSSGSFIFRCGATNASQLYNATAVSGAVTSYTIRIRAKAEYSKFLVIALVDLVGGGYVRVWYDVLAGVVGSTTSGAGVTFVSKSIAPVGDGSFVCELTGLFAAATTIRAAINVSENDAGFTGAAASGLFIYSADIRPGNDGIGLPPYQRVVDANTYDTVGFPSYLKFDGVDDWLQTASVDFSGTNRMLVSAAFRKQSDDSSRLLVESSADANVNNGTFNLIAPVVADRAVRYLSKGTGVNSAGPTLASYPGPYSFVVTGVSSIPTGVVTLTLNGSVAGFAQAGVGPDTGNYGNYPLYIGRRGGTILPFNGRIYSLLIRGAYTESIIRKVERYLNLKAKVF